MTKHEFAFIVEKPECQAIIIYDMGSKTHDFSIPISTEEEAYRLCKQCGVFGFWRLKERRLG